MLTRMTMTTGLVLASTVASFGSTLMPDAVSLSSLTVQVQQVGSVAPASSTNDINSPVAIGSDLYRLNQVNLTPIPLPAGMVLLLSGVGLIAGFRRRATLAGAA